MATDVGRGIMAPDSSDKISSNGVSEMRAIATGAANAIFDVLDKVSAEGEARSKDFAEVDQRIDGTQDAINTTRQDLATESQHREDGDYIASQRIGVLEEGYRPVFAIEDLGNGIGKVTASGTAGGDLSLLGNQDGTFSLLKGGTNGAVYDTPFLADGQFTGRGLNAVRDAIGANGAGLDPAVAEAIRNGTDTKAVLEAWLTAKGTQPILPSDYGAVADGSRQDTTALRAAVAAASAQKLPLYLPPGTYKMVGALVLPSNFELIMHTDAVIDATSMDRAVIQAIGETGSPVQVEGTFAEGLTEITVPDHGLTAGDWAIVRSEDVYDPDSTKTQLGEMVQVYAVNGTTVQLMTPLNDTYKTRPSVTRIVPAQNIRITGGRIVGSNTAGASQAGISIRRGAHINISQVRSEGMDAMHVSLRDCYDTWVERCTFFRCNPTNMGYGVSFADCTRDSGADRCTFTDVRHALSTNNTAVGGGIVRRIWFTRNSVQRTSYAFGGTADKGGDAIDTHTAAEDIYIMQNWVVGSEGIGVNVEARSCVVAFNRIIRPLNIGIMVHNESGRPGDAIITGNRVTDSSGTGIYLREGTRSSGPPIPYTAVTITDNHVFVGDQVGIRHGYIVEGPATIHGNTVITSGEIGIDAKLINGGVIGPDHITNTRAGGVGLKLDRTKNSLVTPGAIKVPGGIGVSAPTDSSNTIGGTGHVQALTKISTS